MIETGRREDLDWPAFQAFARGDNSESVLLAYKRKSIRFLDLRPGDRILDLGCGHGHDAIEMARFVGPGGVVVAIDRSPGAIRRSKASVGPDGPRPHFLLADARHTGLPAASFDVIRSDRILQDNDDPQEILGECVRLLRPGGRLALFEIDWRTLLLEPAERRLTAAIVTSWIDRFPRGSLGHEIPGLCLDLGLEGLSVALETLLVRSYYLSQHLFRLVEMVEHAMRTGAVTGEEGPRWLERLRQADDARFFASVAGFAIRVTKPCSHGAPAAVPDLADAVLT